ncbi:helix-turn-helix domain-containing protein [Kurthia gibsonii]|uniref:helix-turn-helix domain-containing protein n=1 Tax=Kurthia gibsonii TaxID=33946 RepID=UPI0031B6D89D
MKIKLHLKRLMKEKNITQQQLAELANVRQATISIMCNKEMEKIHVPTLEKIINALELKSIDQIITLEKD